MKNQDDKPIIFAATENGRIEILKILLEHGADPSQTNPSFMNYTPLHYAAMFNKVNRNYLTIAQL